MIKTAIRSFLQKFGYDIVKTMDKGRPFPISASDGDLRYYETPKGNYWLPANDQYDVLAQHMKRGKIFEEEIVAEALLHISPGSTVLDVGSNFGQMAIAFAKATGKGGRVYAFEAQDFVFDILKRNIEANDVGQIVNPVFGAVYHTSGHEVFIPEPDFKRFGAYGSYGIDPNATAGRKVKTLTIDDLNIDTPISFMKVDVQGADLFALQGARKTIEKHQMPILFEFEQVFQNDFNTNFQDYVDYVAKIGYKFEKTILKNNYLVIPK